MRVEPGSDAALAGVTTSHSLISIGNVPVIGTIITDGGTTDQTKEMEWANALAVVLHGEDRTPECRFEIFSPEGVRLGGTVVVRLRLNPLFNEIEIPLEVAEPGALTQSLCSPWQADYRECQCFYWASSRPDFVNVEINGNQVTGNNWMDRDRNATSYLLDLDTDDPDLLNYTTCTATGKAFCGFRSAERMSNK